MDEAPKIFDVYYNRCIISKDTDGVDEIISEKIGSAHFLFRCWDIALSFARKDSDFNKFQWSTIDQITHMFHITEFDYDNLDEFGTPEIVASVNMEEIKNDCNIDPIGTIDLRNYAII